MIIIELFTGRKRTPKPPMADILFAGPVSRIVASRAALNAGYPYFALCHRILFVHEQGGHRLYPIYVLNYEGLLMTDNNRTGWYWSEYNQQLEWVGAWEESA